jgi:hypothetical protein
VSSSLQPDQLRAAHKIVALVCSVCEDARCRFSCMPTLRCFSRARTAARSRAGAAAVALAAPILLAVAAVAEPTPRAHKLAARPPTGDSHHERPQSPPYSGFP